jgi:RND family efflux transporter MFP subunit
MIVLNKGAATFLAAVVLAVLSVATAAQDPAPDSTPKENETPRGVPLVLPEQVTLDWIEKSDVAALREGVLESIELQMGMPVAKSKPIGYLHKEIAELTIAKAKVAVSNVATENKAKAQRDVALSVVARNERLNKRIVGAVSKEDMAKAEAEAKVADAMIYEAREKRELDRAELALAEQTELEHTIRAPFDGIIVERFKQPGESVRANEAVVRLANLNKLRAWGYIPLEYAYRVKEGMIVEIQPKLSGGGAPQPIERERFRGKITFVDPQIQPVAESAVRIHADFDNREHKLRPGLKAEMTIYIDPEAPAPTALGNRTQAPPRPR